MFVAYIDKIRNKTHICLILLGTKAATNTLTHFDFGLASSGKNYGANTWHIDTDIQYRRADQHINFPCSQAVKLSLSGTLVGFTVNKIYP